MTEENNITLTEEEKKSGYMVIATKVHPLAAEQLRMLCARVGIRPYKMIQHVVACLIKMMGESSVMEDNGPLHKLIGIFFSELNDFASRYNIADPASKKEITDSIYFLGDHKHSKGRQSVLVTPHQKGKRGIQFPADENWNVAQQLEFFLMNSDPCLYKKIRKAGAIIGAESIYDILHRLAEETADSDALVDEISELFSDNDRGRYGIKPSEHRYKTKQRKSVESFEQELGFRPFGMEL